LKLRFTSDAETELDEAARFYNERQSGLGDEFVATVERGCELLLERPMAWKRLDRRTRQYLLRRFPFGIIYLVEDGEIVVVAIAHLSRKPGYWRARLRSLE